MIPLKIIYKLTSFNTIIIKSMEAESMESELSFSAFWCFPIEGSDRNVDTDLNLDSVVNWSFWLKNCGSVEKPQFLTEIRGFWQILCDILVCSVVILILLCTYCCHVVHLFCWLACYILHFSERVYLNIRGFSKHLCQKHFLMEL